MLIVTVCCATGSDSADLFASPLQATSTPAETIAKGKLISTKFFLVSITHALSRVFRKRGRIVSEDKSMVYAPDSYHEQR